MKKILGLVCLCGIILFGICGCDNKDKKDNLIQELKCSALNNVKQSFGYYFLTNDNDLYVLNTKQLYSNNENCLKINDDFKIVKSIEDYFLDENNKMYLLTAHNSLQSVNEKDMLKSEYDLLFDNNVIKEFDNIVLKNDGKLYKVKYKLSDYKIDEVTLYKEFNDEKILDFGDYGLIRIKYETYDLNTHGTYIKTDKAFYTSTIINGECLKYADIECKYDFQKDDELTSKYNDIVIIHENSYIAKDGKQYETHE